MLRYGIFFDIVQVPQPISPRIDQTIICDQEFLSTLQCFTQYGCHMTQASVVDTHVHTSKLAN